MSRRRFLFTVAGSGAALLAACGAPPASTPTPQPAARATTAPTAAGAAPAGGATAATTPPTRPAAPASPAPASGAPTATAAPAAQGRPGGKKIFKMAWANDIQNLDPAALTTSPDNQLGEAIFSFVVRYTYDPPMSTELLPDLAEKWEVSPDASTFTFYLRKGVKFQRGYGELTAEDVKFAWTRIQNPQTGSRFQAEFAGAAIEAVDQYTVRVKHPKAYPAFLRSTVAYAPGLIPSPKALQELGDRWKTNPVGSGPFQWGKYEPGSSLTIDRFEDFWGQKPKVDQILMRVKIDARTSVLAVARGEIDAYYIDNPDLALEVLRNTPANTTFMKAQQGQAPYWLAFNLKRTPLDDIRVRHALRYAIDVEAIARELFGGLADPVHSFLPPFMSGYSDQVMKFPYDPDRARRLLAEANVPRDWQPAMIGNAQSTHARIIHEAVGSYWTDVGVKVKNELPESSTFLQRRAAGDYDIFGIGVGRVEPDAIATPYWRSGSTVNNSFYTAADDLIDQAKSEPDPERRKQLYAQLQAKIAEDSPAAFIVATSSHLLVNKRVSGIVGAAWLTRIDWYNVDVPAE